MYTNELKEQKFELSTNFKFYSNGKVELEIFRVKSIWFDILLFIPILIYSLFLHVYLVGKNEAIENFKSIFGFVKK